MPNDDQRAADVVKRLQGWAHALLETRVGIVVGHVRRHRLMTISA